MGRDKGHGRGPGRRGPPLGSPGNTEHWRIPPSPHRGSLRVGLAFANQYGVGMANLGFHALWQQLIQAGLQVERVFLPPAQQWAKLNTSGAPLTTLDSRLPLDRLDAIFFSVSFEPDYVGVAQLLNLGRIPCLSTDRNDRDPLLVAGGIAPTLNPEPLARLVDLVGIGEGEALLPPLLELLEQRLDRLAFKEAAAAIPGWYVPGQSQERILKQHAPLTAPCAPVAISSQTAFAKHVDLEISRGCRWRCRFCASGFTVTPYRQLEVEAVRETVLWGVQQRGKVGLVGTDVSDHTGLGDIAELVWGAGGQVALPSLRVEMLARREGVAARLLAHQPPQTLTMAVEAATCSLRAGLGKHLADEKILRAAQVARAAGVRRLRVYLLAAAPGETWQDIEAIPSLARELVAAGPPGGLTLSVTGVVPKAGTPFQWDPAPDRAYLQEVRSFLRRKLPKGTTRLVFESPDWTRWQALLSLGGREVTDIVLDAARRGWRRCLQEAEMQVPFLAPGAVWDLQRSLPWEQVDHGVPWRLLRRERQAAQLRQYVPPAALNDHR